MTETARVATLNIWNRSGPWEERLPLIRSELERLNVDLLGLQEALRFSPGGSPNGAWAVDAIAASVDDQASAIAAGYGFHLAYGAAWDMGGGLYFGNALLSRYPIVETSVFGLPGAETGESRSLLYALVEHPEGLWPIYVTHLNLKLHHGSVRLQQAQFIARTIMERSPIDESRLPPVVMGDFNAEPASDEIRYLTGLHTVEGRSVYFADAWAYGGDGSQGSTFDRKNRFAALAHEPPRRIDYIFVRGPDRAFRGEPLETRVVFDGATPGGTGSTWPSDHFGVVTDIAVRRRAG
jgi:endonuclease/exonuclease/phosphatase family metal-dependent hydrolase